MPSDDASRTRHAHPTDHAIVVGIDGYQPGIPALQGCINDARLFRDWLIDPGGGGLDPDNVHLITGPIPATGRPDRAQIEDIVLGYYTHLTTTGERRGRRLYLYFAGHGVMPQSPFDDDTGVVMGNALRLSLRALLGRTTAKRVRRAALFDEVVLFIDCCRQLTTHVMANCELPDIGDVAMAKRIPYLYGMAAPWAATASEQLLPHPLDPTKEPLWQGVFTHALLHGLRSGIDQQGEVTSTSLRPFVRSAVQELLPPDDNFRPPIELDEDLPAISFGRGARARLDVAHTTADGRGVDEVIIHDGMGLDVIAQQRGANAADSYSFWLAPARYLVVANDAARQLIGRKPIQLFGEAVRVDF